MESESACYGSRFYILSFNNMMSIQEWIFCLQDTLENEVNPLYTEKDLLNEALDILEKLEENDQKQTSEKNLTQKKKYVAFTMGTTTELPLVSDSNRPIPFY